MAKRDQENGRRIRCPHPRNGSGADRGIPDCGEGYGSTDHPICTSQMRPGSLTINGVAQEAPLVRAGHDPIDLRRRAPQRALAAMVLLRQEFPDLRSVSLTQWICSSRNRTQNIRMACRIEISILCSRLASQSSSTSTSIPGWFNARHNRRQNKSLPVQGYTEKGTSILRWRSMTRPTGSTWRWT